MSSGYERYINNVIIIIIIIIIRRTPLKEGQKTPLKPSTDNWEVLYTVKKTPKRNGNVIAKFLLFCSLAPVQGAYTATLLDHEAVNVCSMNERLISLIVQWENDSTFLLQCSSFRCFVQVKLNWPGS